jgi:hypothetical protein
MGDVIQEKCKELADISNSLSTDWLHFIHGFLHSFKAWTTLWLTKKHGEAAQDEANDIEAEFEQLCQTLAGFSPKDVFNMDETRLFYA